MVRRTLDIKTTSRRILTRFSFWGLAHVYSPPALPQNRLPQASWCSKPGHSCCRQLEIFSDPPAPTLLFPPRPHPERSSVTAAELPFLLYIAHAQPAASLLRCGLRALHHHQLLPAIAAA